MRRSFALPTLLAFSLAAAPVSATAAGSLGERAAAVLATAGPGTRFGLVVAAEDGREIVAIAPDERFAPASNTKMFTTAAAFALLDGVDRPDTTGGAAVRLETRRSGAPVVVLEGHGDARLSSAQDCMVDCLSALADAVAAKTRLVSDVIGDDSAFPDQRWGAGMSWEDMETRYGTATSALTLDDNELALSVSPGAPGQAPKVEGLGYSRLDNRAVTGAGGGADLSYDRRPGSDAVRLSGTIGAGAQTVIVRLGIEDPAHYAAWRLKSLLEERGVRVTGALGVRHRAPGPADDPARRGAAPPPRPPSAEPLARLTPPPLAEDIGVTNKVSQNLHAELLLRRVGRVAGTGSIEDGLAAVRKMLGEAGVDRWRFDFSDGSGMTTYNRVSPRATVALLRWAAAQPWGAAWRATLPIAGVDGTLSRRFRGTPLEGKLFAKTGTLRVASALSGYMVARSGRTLIFSLYANDMPEGSPATRAMDEALALVASEN
jgi:D-alanyl-D-alanine carboxypeptidase/D-alanyl-D-alanine-endopeptidase (penicillin-binding protein 4)